MDYLNISDLKSIMVTPPIKIRTLKARNSGIREIHKKTSITETIDVSNCEGITEIKNLTVKNLRIKGSSVRSIVNVRANNIIADYSILETIAETTILEFLSLKGCREFKILEDINTPKIDVSNSAVDRVINIKTNYFNAKEVIISEINGLITDKAILSSSDILKIKNEKISEYFIDFSSLPSRPDNNLIKSEFLADYKNGDKYKRKNKKIINLMSYYKKIKGQEMFNKPTNFSSIKLLHRLEYNPTKKDMIDLHSLMLLKNSFEPMWSGRFGVLLESFLPVALYINSNSDEDILSIIKKFKSLDYLISLSKSKHIEESQNQNSLRGYIGSLPDYRDGYITENGPREQHAFVMALLTSSIKNLLAR